MDEMDEENNELQAELSSMVEEKEKLIAHSTQTRQSESDKVLVYFLYWDSSSTELF